MENVQETQQIKYFNTNNKKIEADNTVLQRVNLAEIMMVKIKCKRVAV